MANPSIYKTAKKYYKETIEDSHARYKSWEHCFAYFGDVKDEDTACLHLAFYLASWGMYRGSSPLLQKDYKIYAKIVKMLLGNRHLRSFQLTGADELIPDILQVKAELKMTLQQVIEKEPTDNLLSKIILGTLGCVPAYDRFVITGLEHCGFKHTFTVESLLEISNFGKNHIEDIQKIKEETKNNEVEYTEMKILDMYFWQIGYELAGNKALVKNRAL